MADVDIVAQLDDKQIQASINQIVKIVEDGATKAAEAWNNGVQLMQESMRKFVADTRTRVSEIKQSFLELGVAFDSISDAIKKAAELRGQGGGGTGGAGAGYAPNTVGELEQIVRLEETRRKDMQLNSDELRQQNLLIEQQRKELQSQKTSDPAKDMLAARRELSGAFSMADRSLGDAEAKLKRLQQIAANFKGKGILDETQWNHLNKQIDATQAKIERLRIRQPMSMRDVMGMDESSLQAISTKLTALKGVQIDPKNSAQVRQLGDEYQRLLRLQAQMMGKGIQLTHSNNLLAQSFNYIRNRLVSALTIGAMTTFINQLYQVRGEYELLERSLGILADDMRRGSQMFEELNQMAMKSPFTLIDLATGAKQLLAYNFAEEEVVDTTRRLADISAALGAPMERLVYNLGQIRAQTVLTARDARDFANAGLAIVPMLAQMYTEQKRFGDEMVTTRDVFDMMSKKMVTYADVMQVINKVTDEGGKFFDFQAKQADTLKVRLANLKLAWNNMLNDIGTEQQKALTMPLSAMKYLFEHWRALSRVISTVVLALGSYKAAVVLANLWTNRLAIKQSISAFISLAKSIKSAEEAMILFNTAGLANPIGLIAGAIAAVVGYFVLFNNSVEDATVDIERFGKSGAKAVREAESLFQLLTLTSKESSNYGKVMSELNSILGEYNLETIKETDTLDEINKRRKISIALIREEASERKYLNDIEQGNNTYEKALEKAKSELQARLKKVNVQGLFTSDSKEVRKNANAIAAIIANTVEADIDSIVNVSEEEYTSAMEKLRNEIRQKMLKIGMSERAVNREWEDLWNRDIIRLYIESVQEAAEEHDRFNAAISKTREEEKATNDATLSFNDRVKQTQSELDKAANDTDRFHTKIEKLLKDYGSQNLIDFLVRVKTEVPKWMMDKNLGELTQLASRFTALATEAKKAGKKSVNVNGKDFTPDELAIKAATYNEAAQQKANAIQATKSSSIIKAASEALKDYKESLDAARISRNKMAQGEATQALVDEKDVEVQKAYNKALKAGVTEQELLEAKEGKKGRGGSSKKDVLGDALQEQIRLINELKKTYNRYLDDGRDKQTALNESTQAFTESLEKNNAILKKYGIEGVTGERFAEMSLQDLRTYYDGLLVKAQGTAKGTEAIERAIRDINADISKLDSKRIIEGLNSTLTQVKEGYEIGVEFDANPELGALFADMMGISEERLAELPRNYQDAIEQLQKGIDAELGDGVFDLESLLNKADFNEWVKSMGFAVDKGFIPKLEEMREYIVKLRLDEGKAQMKEWEDLLKKFDDYEARKNEIIRQAEKDRATARKHNADESVLKAIDRQTEEELAQLRFEQFQKSGTWITATGTLSTLTREALTDLIAKVEEFKRSAKGLNGKQIKEINTALRNLRKEVRKENPFADLMASIDEARSIQDNYLSDIMVLEQEINDIEQKPFQTKEDIENLQLYKMWLEKIRDEQQKMGKVSFSAAMQGVNVFISGLKQVLDMLEQVGDDLNAESLKSTVEVLSDVTGFYQSIASGAQSGGLWGAAISGVTYLVPMLVKWMTKQQEINDKIEESERAVSRLELRYKELQTEVDSTYGMTQLGAQRAAVEVKKLELEELRHQLLLEESRKEKNKDQEKIDDIKGKIIDLESEIESDVHDITNSLLGISSVGDAIEKTISSMIDAFKNGEDYMKVFDQTFDDMIDNMIVKSLMSSVIGDRIEQFVSKWESRTTNKRAEDAQGKEYQSQIQKAKDNLAEEQRKLEELETRYLKMESSYGSGGSDVTLANLKSAKADVEAQKSKVQRLMETIEALEREFEDYVSVIEISPEDIEEANNDKQTLREGIKERFLQLMELLGVSQGEAVGEQELSALQQGIKGITETQAGALEAYANNMWQQSIEQTQLLREICDATALLNLDVYAGTQAQILLSLQQSYQVQMAIQSMLSGWSNPVGNAVRVEMV